MPRFIDITNKRRVIIDLAANPEIAKLLGNLVNLTGMKSHQQVIAMALKQFEANLSVPPRHHMLTTTEKPREA